MNVSALSHAGVSSCREEAFSSVPPVTGKHQTAACQRVCPFLTSFSPVMVTERTWLMLVSVLRSSTNKKRMSGFDRVFMDISIP